MIGCKHNIERKIKYPVQPYKRWTKPSFEAAQEIKLVCPRGCGTLSIEITVQGKKDKR